MRYTSDTFRFYFLLLWFVPSMNKNNNPVFCASIDDALGICGLFHPDFTLMSREFFHRGVLVLWNLTREQ